MLFEYLMVYVVEKLSKYNHLVPCLRQAEMTILPSVSVTTTGLDTFKLKFSVYFLSGKILHWCDPQPCPDKYQALPGQLLRILKATGCFHCSLACPAVSCLTSYHMSFCVTFPYFTHLGKVHPHCGKCYGTFPKCHNSWCGAVFHCPPYYLKNFKCWVGGCNSKKYPTSFLSDSTLLHFLLGIC